MIFLEDSAIFAYEVPSACYTSESPIQVCNDKYSQGGVLGSVLHTLCARAANLQVKVQQHSQLMAVMMSGTCMIYQVLSY